MADVLTSPELKVPSFIEARMPVATSYFEDPRFKGLIEITENPERAGVRWITTRGLMDSLVAGGCTENVPVTLVEQEFIGLKPGQKARLYVAHAVLEGIAGDPMAQRLRVTQGFLAAMLQRDKGHYRIDSTVPVNTQPITPFLLTPAGHIFAS